MKKFNLFLIVGLICGAVLGGLICCHAGEAKAAPVTDGNGDGVVNMLDLGALAGDWLGTGYAGIEGNCRIDFGFYTGDSNANWLGMLVEHGLGRVPDVVLVFPLNPDVTMQPSAIIGDPDTGYAMYKFFDGVPMFRTSMLAAPTADSFTVFNVGATEFGGTASSKKYHLNRADTRYFYIALCKEIPAMPAE